MRELTAPSRDLGEICAAVLARRSRFQFRARGHSMVPAIRDGDVLIVEPVDNDQLKTGEIVLCRMQPSRLVVHRIIARHAGCHGPVLVIRGDAFDGPGEAIERCCVLGRVAAIKRQNWFAGIARRISRSQRFPRFLIPRRIQN